MKIDLEQPIKTLSGEVYKNVTKDLTLGGVISEALAASETGGKLKMYVLAQEAFKGGEMDVDSADFSLIKTAVETNKSYGNQGNIILGQALEMLNQVK